MVGGISNYLLFTKIAPRNMPGNVDIVHQLEQNFKVWYVYAKDEIKAGQELSMDREPLLDYDDVTIEVESEEQEMIQHPHPDDV